MRNRFIPDTEGDYQEYLGEVITRNTQREVAGAEGRDSYRRPNPNAPRFSQEADDRRQLRALSRADKSPMLKSQLLPNAMMRPGQKFSGR